MTYKTKKRSKKGKGIGKWVSKFTKKSKPIELPLSTIEQLELISRPINEVKKVFEEHSNKIDGLYNKCLNSCRNYNCLGNDEMCQQLNDMINTKPLYNWSNFCAHSLNQNLCKEFLESYKILEIYTNNLIDLGKKAQLVRNLLDAYNNKII